MVTTHSTEQNSEAWLAERVGKFTGSNAIKLLRYGRTDKARVQSVEFKGNKYTQRGHDLEPFAISAYEQVKDVKVERPGFITNDEYPECLFSPDGLTEEHVIEVKCFGEERHHKVRKDIPAEILAQIHFGMLMTEKTKAHLVMFNPDIDSKRALYIVPVKRDKRLLARLDKLMRGVQ